MTIAKNSAISSSSSPKNQKNVSNNKFDLLSSTTQEEFPALARKEGPSDADVQKEKAMGTIVGIPPLSLEPLVEDVTEEEDESVESPAVLEPIAEGPELLQFTEAEVQVELNYWRNSVYCFILAANPPWEIVEGFIRRLWVNYQVDKLSFLPNGVFMVHFKNKGAMAAVLKQGHFLFDNKPLIVKPWTPDVELIKHEVKSVPVWVKLHQLPLKFWGKGIPKIAGLLGNYIKCDPATEEKTRIGYARVMIEVSFGSALLDKVRFLDEHGDMVEVEVEYEWKPVACDVCHGVGHLSADCTYSSGPTPIRPIMRMSRQETTEGACSVHTFGQQTFLEALNKSNTPKVDFCDYFAQCINMRILEIATGKIFFLSMVYGFNDIIARQELWEQLVQFASTVDGPWLACVDRSHAMGSLFTWNNKQDVTTRVYSRLDRALINREWGHQMPDMFAHFLPEGDFDHTPCIIKCRNQHMHHKKPFKYYNMWGKAPQYHNSISTWWNMYFKGTKMFCLVTKLKQLKGKFRQYNQEHFCDIEKSSIMALKNLEYIQSQLATNPGDLYWSAKESQALNEYKDLNDAYTNGKEHEDPQQIQAAFLNYYIHLLGTESHTVSVNPKIIRKGSVCTASHAAILLKPVTSEEIKAAIFSIPDHKAPGPDGYSSAFFKDSWSVIGGEVCDAIKDVFRTGKILKQLNTTILTLIPKWKMPTHVTQFRPIACCNVLYKCVSKLICARLAEILPDLISLNQGGFIKGRSIIENILVCEDLVRLYNRQACSPRCMFKMDLMKAYDSVSWKFLGELLTAFKFPPHFKELVMNCVTSASFSIALNGDTFGFFPGKRGLRQGDPMSPLLFTLSMEYLSRIIKCATEKLHFNYHPLCKSMKLTHLMFADDLLLFCKGNAHFIMVLLRAYSAFSVASGLQMNAQKSYAYFNGVSNSLRKEILSASGFSEGKLPFKYLGVPITAGRLKKNDCGVLIDKIVERIRSLGARKLSYAGRLVLVSSVLSTMHNYWASIFVLPKGVLNRVDAICRNFLWEGNTEYNRVPSVGWHKVCVPKREGGLGLHQSYYWNVAMVGKLVWWLCYKPDRLWVQWVNHIYIKNADCLDYTPSTDVTWYWKKVCRVKEIIKEGFVNGQWSVGVGDYSVRRCGRFQTQEHLFSSVFSKKAVLQRRGSWLSVDLDQDNMLAAITRRRWSKLKKTMATAALLACWYAIWFQRNSARLKFVVDKPEYVATQVKVCLKARFSHCMPSGIKQADSRWLATVC
ncbi:uncharacterized protein LOC141631542 [Silene latifolia]|uniref:uncharacterized protein LOC141631542 n=1 Tax=Silene latifolia TaxID=37657 RepID=UPI003D7727B6